MTPEIHTRPRHVGLNAHLLNLAGNYRSAGINWYIYHLLRNLPGDGKALAGEQADFDFTVFLSESRAIEHFTQVHLDYTRLPTQHPIVRIAWEQFVLPFALRRARIELYHGLAFAGPVATAIPWVITIYDLSFVRYPGSFNNANRIYLNWAVHYSLKRANRVIAISESTKRDLVDRFGIAPGRVAVVYGASDPTFSPAPDAGTLQAFRARHHLPERMILHVGTIEPRKNIARLVRAFARAKREARLPHTLVLIGARGWKYAEVDTAIQDEGVEQDVIFAGYVPQNEMPDWFRAADLFVYPSLYEGFGLPPLEAMACGTPVVASNASSLPEVVGDAALVVSPEDEAELASTIVRALSTPSLREEMRARGLVQAAQFSWNRTARETLDVYRTVFAGHARGRE